MPFGSLEKALALADELPSQIVDAFTTSLQFTVCESWQSGVADLIEHEAVYSDVPTLVLAGRYDPSTPPPYARLAAETLSNSFYYEFPNLGHGVMRSGGCGTEIGLQFIDDPTTEPDASCIDEIAGLDFK